MEMFMKWTFAWFKNPPRIIEKFIECVQSVTVVYKFPSLTTS